jgi:hypothetical protein
MNYDRPCLCSECQTPMQVCLPVWVTPGEESVDTSEIDWESSNLKDGDMWYCPTCDETGNLPLDNEAQRTIHYPLVPVDGSPPNHPDHQDVGQSDGSGTMNVSYESYEGDSLRNVLIIVIGEYATWDNDSLLTAAIELLYEE